MKRILTPLVPAAAMLLLTPLPAMAQTAPAPPPAAAAPGPAGQPTAEIPRVVQERLIDGPVKKVDPTAKTVQVGWFFGLLSTTLEVTEGTHIAVEGATASLQDVREGDEVKASYETRDGKYIATSIEAMRPEATGGAGPAKRGPGASPSSLWMELRESSAPPAGGAKTP
jgi:Cu/Ag efflux protein CusF